MLFVLFQVQLLNVYEHFYSSFISLFLMTTPKAWHNIRAIVNRNTSDFFPFLSHFATCFMTPYIFSFAVDFYCVMDLFTFLPHNPFHKKPMKAFASRELFHSKAYFLSFTNSPYSFRFIFRSFFRFYVVRAPTRIDFRPSVFRYGAITRTFTYRFKTPCGCCTQLLLTFFTFFPSLDERFSSVYAVKASN